MPSLSLGITEQGCSELICSHLRIKKRNYLFYITCMRFCLNVCLCIMCVPSAQGCQKRAFHPPKLELGWVLGVEHVFSVRITSDLNHRVLSPVPKMCIPGWPWTCELLTSAPSAHPTSTSHHNRNMHIFKKKLHRWSWYCSAWSITLLCCYFWRPGFTS